MTYIYKSFDEYLRVMCMEINSDEMLSDDEWVDYYDNWIAEQSREDIMKWAELYGERKYVQGGMDVLKKFDKQLGGDK